MGKSLRVTMIGSFIALDLPDRFADLFAGGVLVDPRNHTPMEMDGYSAYLALTALERRNGLCAHDQKRQLVDAVLARLERTDPPFAHGAMTGSPREVHMRFTAAAVRLLHEAYRDRLLPDPAPLVAALRYHLSFVETTDLGDWFLHDSLEMAKMRLPSPLRRTKARTWGSSIDNNLVLNTHLDTLSTMLHIRSDLADDAGTWLDERIEAGMATLVACLDSQAAWWAGVGRVESTVRTALFQTFRWTFTGVGRLRRVAQQALLTPRMRLRARHPVFVFPDGYIERDISLGGESFEYHLVNVSDFARLAAQLQTLPSNFSVQQLAARCGRIADNGLRYAVTSAYWHHVLQSTLRSNRAVLFCEALVLRWGTPGSSFPPGSLLDRYLQVRKRISPSAALIGYDPYVVNATSGSGPISPGVDRLHLLDGTRVDVEVNSTSSAPSLAGAPVLA